MYNFKDTKKKILNAKNAKELLEAINPLFLNEYVEGSPSPGKSSNLDTIRYMARQAALRLYEENELLPEPPATEELTEIRKWCIKANRVSGEATKMGLREFFEKRTDAETDVIDSKIKRIKAVDKQKQILPKTANNPKGNQTKLYYENDLKNVWSKLKDEIPTLPNLKN